MKCLIIVILIAIYDKSSNKRPPSIKRLPAIKAPPKIKKSLGFSLEKWYLIYLKFDSHLPKKFVLFALLKAF